MHRIAFGALLPVLLGASAVLAQEGPSLPPPGQDFSAPASESIDGSNEDDDGLVVTGKKKRVCEVVTATGSMMPRKKCRTVAQVEADQEKAQQTLDQLQLEREAQQNAQRQREMTKGA